MIEVRALGSIHTSHTSTTVHSCTAMVLSVLTSFRFPIPCYRVSITDLCFDVKGPYVVNSPQNFWCTYESDMFIIVSFRIRLRSLLRLQQTSLFACKLPWFHCQNEHHRFQHQTVCEYGHLIHFLICCCV